MTGDSPVQLPADLSPAQVQQIARLARLELNEAQRTLYQKQLAKVLLHFESMRSLDLTQVEPLTHPTLMNAPLASDQPERSLSSDGVIRLAPDAAPPFIKVPRVLPGSDQSS